MPWRASFTTAGPALATSTYLARTFAAATLAPASHASAAHASAAITSTSIATAAQPAHATDWQQVPCGIRRGRLLRVQLLQRTRCV